MCGLRSLAAGNVQAVATAQPFVKRKKNALFSLQVTLHPYNTLNIVLNGKPRSVVMLEIDGAHNDPVVFHVIGVATNEVAQNTVSRPGSIDNAEGQVTDILFGSYAGVSGVARIATLNGRAESVCSGIG